MMNHCRACGITSQRDLAELAQTSGQRCLVCRTPAPPWSSEERRQAPKVGSSARHAKGSTCSSLSPARLWWTIAGQSIESVQRIVKDQRRRNTGAENRY
jgi:hypothetical protein